MKVEKRPPTEFDVVITLNQQEAEVVLKVVGGITGIGVGRNVTNELYYKLIEVGLVAPTDLEFLGKFL